MLGAFPGNEGIGVELRVPCDGHVTPDDNARGKCVHLFHGCWMQQNYTPFIQRLWCLGSRCTRERPRVLHSYGSQTKQLPCGHPLC